MRKFAILITCMIIAYSCEKYKINDQKYEDIFSLEITNSMNAKADGVTLIKLDLKSINSEIKSGLKAILESKAGTLVESEKILDKNGNATFYLRTSQDTSNYFVNVKVLDDSKQVYFEQKHLIITLARPDTIFIESTKSTYKPTDFITLKTYIYRNQGKPSQKIPINYSAYQTDNSNNKVNVGRFEGLYNNTSSVDGTYADIKFYADSPNIDTTKVITIKVETKKDNNLTTFNLINFQYKK